MWTTVWAWNYSQFGLKRRERAKLESPYVTEKEMAVERNLIDSSMLNRHQGLSWHILIHQNAFWIETRQLIWSIVLNKRLTCQRCLSQRPSPLSELLQTYWYLKPDGRPDASLYERFRFLEVKACVTQCSSDELLMWDGSFYRGLASLLVQGLI